MSRELQSTCPSCGNELYGAMEFRPVCILRKALADGVESGESSFEEAAKPTPKQAVQRFEHYELVKCVTEKPAKIGFRSRYSLRLYSWAKKARLDRNQAPFIGAASTSAAYFNSILRLPEPLPNCASGVVLKGGIQIFFSRKKHRCRIGFSAQSELCERAFPGTPIQVDLPRSRRLHSKCLGDPPGSGYRISKLGTSKRLGTA